VKSGKLFWIKGIAGEKHLDFPQKLVKVIQSQQLSFQDFLSNPFSDNSSKTSHTKFFLVFHANTLLFDKHPKAFFT